MTIKEIIHNSLEAAGIAHTDLLFTECQTAPYALVYDGESLNQCSDYHTLKKVTADYSVEVYYRDVLDRYRWEASLMATGLVWQRIQTDEYISGEAVFESVYSVEAYD